MPDTEVGAGRHAPAAVADSSRVMPPSVRGSEQDADRTPDGRDEEGSGP
ncbi:hypothetical protein [Streptomyces chartreusis]